MQAETTKKSILLVHGAWHSARCWESFTPVLEAQGFAVHTMTLPGHGEKARFGWFVGMRDYVRAVGATADAIVQKSGSPCVLLGHSMGGLVISAAAEARPSLFSALVYLAAFVPTRAPASSGFARKFRSRRPRVTACARSTSARYFDMTKSRAQFFYASERQPAPLAPHSGRIDAPWRQSE